MVKFMILAVRGLTRNTTEAPWPLVRPRPRYEELAGPQKGTLDSISKQPQALDAKQQEDQNAICGGQNSKNVTPRSPSPGY